MLTLEGTVQQLQINLRQMIVRSVDIGVKGGDTTMTNGRTRRAQNNVTTHQCWC